MKNIDDYIEKLTASVYERISTDICENKLDEIASNVMKHTNDSLFKFHKYYIETLSDKFKSKFISSDNFFHKFKYQYSLQGISNYFLDKKLETAKPEILKLIEDDRLSELYYDFFAKAEVQREGDEIKVKSLGSFFTKLVHTFNPSQYCALDNPVKDYFKLTNESFFIAFIVISNGYRNWANNNGKLLSLVREHINEVDKQNQLELNKLTDMKLFDLIFRINSK